MTTAIRWDSRRLQFYLLAFLIPLFIGCAGVKLVADYDEVTDKSLTAIQQKTDDFIEKLIKKSETDEMTKIHEASFETNKAFYDDIEQQLRSLEFRVSSIPKNGKTIELVKKIRTVIVGESKCSSEGSSLRDLHCLSGSRGTVPSAPSLEITRRNVNQTISAVLSLELAKKQGLAQNK